LRQIIRVLASLVLTCFFGLIGYILYLLSYGTSYADGHNGIPHPAARWLGYLLIWPVFAIQKLGGVNPGHYGTSWEPTGTLGWIGLWIYYYLLVVVCERWVRKG
jgi:hypothetical protein